MNPQITPLPTPPSTKESASFDERADAFLSALPTFAEELNEFAKQTEQNTQKRINAIIDERADAFSADLEQRFLEGEKQTELNLITQIAAQTERLTRSSYQFIEDLGVKGEKQACFYQKVDRENAQESDEKIVRHKDIFAPIVKFNANATYAGLRAQRLNLPQTLREVLSWQNYITYTDPVVTTNYVCVEGGERFLLKSIVGSYTWFNISAGAYGTLEIIKTHSSSAWVYNNLMTNHYFDIYFTPGDHLGIDKEVIVSLTGSAGGKDGNTTFSGSFNLGTMKILAKNQLKIDLFAGNDYTHEIEGIKIASLTATAQKGIARVEIAQDTQSARVFYTAPLSETPLSDELVITTNGTAHTISVQIHPLPQDYTEDELDQKLEYTLLSGHTNAFLAAVEGYNFVFLYGLNPLNSSAAYVNHSTYADLPLKFTFPAKVKKVVCGGFGGYNPTYTSFTPIINAVLLENGDVWVMGKNTNGELGTNNTIESYFFIKSPYLSNIKDIFMSGYNLGEFALSKDGKVYSWGLNKKVVGSVSFYTSGLNRSDEKILKPELVDLDEGMVVKEVIRGWTTNCLLLENGEVLITGKDAKLLTTPKPEGDESAFSDNTDSLVFEKVLKKDNTPLQNVKKVCITQANNKRIVVFFLTQNDELYMSFDKEDTSKSQCLARLVAVGVKDIKCPLMFSVSLNVGYFYVAISFKDEPTRLYFPRQCTVVPQHLQWKNFKRGEFEGIEFGAKVLDFEIRYDKTSTYYEGALAVVLHNKDGDELYFTGESAWEKVKD